MRNGKKQVIWIAIEGQIAVGKSTLIKSLAPYFTVEFGEGSVVWIPEPVDKWQTHLAKCGQDPKRFSYVTQTHIFNTRYKAFRAAFDANPDARIFISERSPMSDYHVFWETNAELHDLDPIDIQTYPQIWDTWMDLYPTQPAAYIYLELDIEECQRRQRERNRECEDGVVTAEYQSLLQKGHERMFTREKIAPLRIDAAANYRDDPKVAKEYATKLISIIKDK